VITQTDRHALAYDRVHDQPPLYGWRLIVMPKRYKSAT